MLYSNEFGQALPSLKTQLKAGGEYTIILQPDGLFIFPTITKVRNELESRIFPPILRVISIDWHTINKQYTVAFKMLTDTTFDTLSGYIQTVFKDMIGRNVSVVGFKTELLPTEKVGGLPTLGELKPLVYVAVAGLVIIYLAPVVGRLIPQKRS